MRLKTRWSESQTGDARYSQRGRGRAVWPICASKYRCVVNPKLRENSEVAEERVRSHRPVRGGSPETSQARPEGRLCPEETVPTLKNPTWNKIKLYPM